MRMISSLLLLWGAVFAFAASTSPDPAEILYERGVKMAEQGRFHAARLAFSTLVNTYPKSPQASEAQYTINATLLFEDGQARLIAGKYGTARLAFQTLIVVYPESPLVKQAADRMRMAERLEQAQSIGPTVRSLRFENTDPVKVDDIRQRLQEREIELDVEKAYDAKMVEEARRVLTELLAERGVANPRVEVSIREIPPRSVDVAFQVK
ncbi:MAG: tetratricopeptide repeat protein [Acidobacteriia bacterium]|nr:tetratricopeptide repeat protein [Terriglobia bacterium]